MSMLIAPTAATRLVGRNSYSDGISPISDATALLHLCTHLDEQQQVHALLLKTSLLHRPPVLCRLISCLSGEPNGVHYARKLFDRCEGSRRSTFVYNTMIKAYARSPDPEQALLLYGRMVGEDQNLFPDQFTFTFLLAACAKLRAVSEGRQTHAKMVKSAPETVGTHAKNSLMAFYAKVGGCGSPDLFRLFDDISHPDVVSWNTLLDGLAKLGDLKSARKVFVRMPRRDVVSWTTMLVVCAEAGLLDEACRLFDEMPVRNVVSWSAIICGFARQGFYKEALLLFQELQRSGIEADNVILTTLLSASANLGSLEHGRWLHGYVKKQRMAMDAHLSTALVDMYAKSGRLDLAREIFRNTTHQNAVFLWNAMLGGLAMHSRGMETVKLFLEMIESGIQPNEISFICVLSACSHSRLIDNGLQILCILLKDPRVTLTSKHYGCLVDLLARAGLLSEAKTVIQKMQVEADGDALRALLSASVLHGDVSCGECVGRLLLELEPGNDENYILLSNLYALAGRWGDVAELRMGMRGKGLRKTPGCSSIELNGIAHEFVAGDVSHSSSAQIYETLNVMVRQLTADAAGTCSSSRFELT